MFAWSYCPNSLCPKQDGWCPTKYFLRDGRLAKGTQIPLLLREVFCLLLRYPLFLLCPGPSDYLLLGLSCFLMGSRTAQVIPSPDASPPGCKQRSAHTGSDFSNRCSISVQDVPLRDFAVRPTRTPNRFVWCFAAPILKCALRPITFPKQMRNCTSSPDSSASAKGSMARTTSTANPQKARSALDFGQGV